MTEYENNDLEQIETMPLLSYNSGGDSILLQDLHISMKKTKRAEGPMNGNFVFCQGSRIGFIKKEDSLV